PPAPPPQPLRTRMIDVKQQTTTLTLGPGIRLPLRLYSAHFGWRRSKAGCLARGAALSEE
ncbi:MAG: hypothetical protein WBE44_20625, partial [Terriglobales bacterium]